MKNIDYKIIEPRKILLKKIKEFSKHSELTEEDAVLIGRKINKSMSKRFMSEK